MLRIRKIEDCGCIVWGDCGKQNALHLERLQNQATRIILRANRKTCTQFMRSKLTLLSSSRRRRFMRLQLVYKIINIDCPCMSWNPLKSCRTSLNSILKDKTIQSWASCSRGSFTTLACVAGVKRGGGREFGQRTAPSPLYAWYAGYTTQKKW